MSARPSRPSCSHLYVADYPARGVGVQEQGGVKVTSMAFNGLKAVKASQLKSVLATGASSKLPGREALFSRASSSRRIQRIAAFYHDRGYPEARVSSFDVKLSADQSSVAITLNISEGQPLLAERVELQGFEVLPADHRRSLETRLPLKAGQPMDRALIRASHESALDELKDHGYPYATVRLSESAGASDLQRVLTLAAEPGPLAHHGPLEIQGNSSVGDGVIRRQPAFRRGEVFSQSKLLESQRKLYDLEVFQFANAAGSRGRREAPRDPDPRHGHGREAPQGELQPRVRQRGEGPGRG